METREIVKGLCSGENKDGVKVFKLHYSADPGKDPETEKGAAWCESIYRLFPGGKNGSKFRREMEIDWGAGSGDLVFPFFGEKRPQIVVSQDLFTDEFLARCQLFGGLDWGKRNPVSFHVYAETPENEFYAIWEWYERGNDPITVAKCIKNSPYYKRLNWIAADPSMWNENQANAARDGFTSYARIFMEDMPEKVKLDKLMPGHSKKDTVAVDILNMLWQVDKPTFFIGDNCEMLIKELGNLRHPANVYEKNEPEKILDKDNHAFDDLKYFLTSHPSAGKFSERQKFGTFGFLNKASELANQIAAETGESPQRVFDRIYFDGSQL